jgi:hypothetical protein
MKETNPQLLRDSAATAASYPRSKDESAALQDRLAAKEHWKSQAGHRYTPEELKRMSEAADVKIYRRKRLVMKY